MKRSSKLDTPRSLLEEQTFLQNSGMIEFWGGTLRIRAKGLREFFAPRGQSSVASQAGSHLNRSYFKRVILH